MRKALSVLAGGFLVLGAALCSGADAWLNFEAYAGVFGHAFMGLGGLACAVLAFGGASAASVAARSGQAATAALCLTVAAVAGLASINGTFLRLTSAGVEVVQDQADRANGYDLALTQLQRAERDLAAIESDLSVVRAGDTAATQALMKAKGFYDGGVDGRLGPKTETALQRFSAELSDRRAEARGIIAQAETVVRGGRPVEVAKPMSDTRALVFAIALTALGAFGGSAGFATIAPQIKRRKRRTPKDMEDSAAIIDLTQRLHHAIG